MKFPEMYLGDIESGLTGPSFRRRLQTDERERECATNSSSLLLELAQIRFVIHGPMSCTDIFGKISSICAGNLLSREAKGQIVDLM